MATWLAYKFRLSKNSSSVGELEIKINTSLTGSGVPEGEATV